VEPYLEAKATTVLVVAEVSGIVTRTPPTDDSEIAWSASFAFQRDDGMLVTKGGGLRAG